MTFQTYYDSLTPEEQAKYDALPDSIKAQIHSGADAVGGEWADFNQLFSTDESWRAFMAMPLMQQQAYVTQQLVGGKPTQLAIIQDNSITPSASDVRVDTEGQAPTDDLTIIIPANTNDGMHLNLWVASPERTVTVKHNPEQLHGITLEGGKDKTLAVDSYISLKRDGTDWKEIVSNSIAVEPVPVATTTELGIARIATPEEIANRTTGENGPCVLPPEALATLETTRIYKIGKPENGDPLDVSPNYVFADGRTITLANYPELQAKISAGTLTVGEAYSASLIGIFSYTDETKTAVYVPNLLNQFMRFGTAAQLGQNHLDAMQRLTGTFAGGSGNGQPLSSGVFKAGANCINLAGGPSRQYVYTFDNALQARTANETCPVRTFTYPVIYLGKTRGEI